MSDTQLLLRVFGLISEPLIFAKKELVQYMNPAAIELVGKDMSSKPISLVLPSHILNTQAERFTATAFVGDKSCIVKASSYEGLKIFALDSTVPEPDENEAVNVNLRALLTNVKFASSCIGVLAENDGNEKILEHVASLNRSYYRIKRILDNVTCLQLMARGELPFNPAPLDITAACRRLLDEVKGMDILEKISLSFNAEEKLYIVADRHLIQQLLLNLIANSISHCHGRGRIGVSLLRTDRNLILAVDDNGDGIAKDDLAFAFDSYKHVNTPKRAQGSGLGLAIVRGIAELHKGAVIIESRGENMGTSVRVMLSYDVPISEQFKQGSSDESICREQLYSQLSDVIPPKKFIVQTEN